MCGINGILTGDNELKRKIALMNRILRHRGPDDEGIVGINTSAGRTDAASFSSTDTIPSLKNKHPQFLNSGIDSYNLFLGHRRLAIIDLSENGHGPMSDTTGKIWITFNGEIYNYIELREELKRSGFIFRTASDTEVIINAYISPLLFLKSATVGIPTTSTLATNVSTNPTTLGTVSCSFKKSILRMKLITVARRITIARVEASTYLCA